MMRRAPKSPIAPRRPGACPGHTAADAMAASKQAASADPLEPRMVPRLDRDIHRRPRSMPNAEGYSSIAAAGGDDGRRAQQHVSRSMAVPRSTALPLARELASSDEEHHRMNGIEDAVGNRFARTELCGECGLRFSESNYVATTAEGQSWCGDCWDAYLGVTLVMASNRHPSALCACGRDLHTDVWFTVDLAAQQTPYCRTCSLSYWGVSSSDFTVTIINDGSNVNRTSHGGDTPFAMQRQGLSTAVRFSGLLPLALAFLVWRAAHGPVGA